MWNLVKFGQAGSEKKTLKDYEILYMYIAQGQGQITSEGKLLIVLKGSYIVHFSRKFLIHLKTLTFQYFPHTNA